MQSVIYGICGVIGGVLGGMGMGGGTVLIPILAIFCEVGQHAAQGVNLISFIPMAVLAIVLHLKNKLINFKYVMYCILPGVLTCVIGCFIAKSMSGDLLRRCFGGFLLILSGFQFIYQIRNSAK